MEVAVLSGFLMLLGLADVSPRDINIAVPTMILVLSHYKVDSFLRELLKGALSILLLSVHD